MQGGGHKHKEFQGLPWWFSVPESLFSLQGALELRSHMLNIMVKKKKKKGGGEFRQEDLPMKGRELSGEGDGLKGKN